MYTSSSFAELYRGEVPNLSRDRVLDLLNLANSFETHSATLYYDCAKVYICIFKVNYVDNARIFPQKKMFCKIYKITIKKLFS